MIKITIEGLTPAQIEDKYRSTIQCGVEVMRFAMLGMMDSEIGKHMHLSTGAVKSRLKVFYPVIGAVNRAHAVAICVARGWLTPEDLSSAMNARLFRSTQTNGGKLVVSRIDRDGSVRDSRDVDQPGDWPSAA